MASNYTEHYDLCQWEATDQVQRTDFNADNAKVDAALNTLAGQVAEKAEMSTVSSLLQMVANKAEQSALNSEATARIEADVALQGAMLRLVVGSYEGDGSYGSTGARTLDFSASLGRPPKAVFS